MDLYVMGKKAKQHMDVETFQGEQAILLSWTKPGTPSGGNGGRVYIQLESGSCREFFPSVINGEFK